MEESCNGRLEIWVLHSYGCELCFGYIPMGLDCVYGNDWEMRMLRSAAIG